MSFGSDEPSPRKRKFGFYLLTGFLFAWLATMIALQVHVGREAGYGLGISDGGRTPPAIVRSLDVGPGAAEISAATRPPRQPMPVVEGFVRVSVTVFLMVGVVTFWFVIISRIGVF